MMNENCDFSFNSLKPITWTKEFKLMLYTLTLRRHSIKSHINALSVNLRHII